MPSNLPTNDFRRLILARSILSNARQDRRKGRPLLPVRYEKAFQEATDAFDAAMKHTDFARADYAKELDRRNQLLPQLALETRSFIACLKYRFKRGIISKEVHARYQVQPAKRRPHGPCERGWVLQASWLLEGEAWSQAHGYPAVNEPDAESLTALLDATRSAMEAADAADAYLMACQTELRGIRKRLMKQLSRIQWALKSELLAQDTRPEYIRRVLHRYGFRTRKPKGLPKDYFPWEQRKPKVENSLESGSFSQTNLPPPFT